MTGGEPTKKSKIRKSNSESFTDYFLKLDQEKQFTSKKFNQIQKLNQRKKKLKRKIINRKQKSRK